MRAMMIAVTAVVLGLLAASVSTGAEVRDESGFRALSGHDAATFTIPSDMRPVRAFELDALGLRYERFQQYSGAVPVLGAQITVIRGTGGQPVGVIGARYPQISPTNGVNRSVVTAERRVENDVGAAARTSRLVLDPHTARYLYEIESRGFSSRWFHYVDAESGAIVRRINAVDSGEGIGVKGDTKDLTDLTIAHGGGHGVGGPHYDLISADTRQVAYDAENGTSILFPATDVDDSWDLDDPFGESPGQSALVDAHYYANVSDDYFQTEFGLDWIADCGYAAMLSAAHFEVALNNAFWNGTFVVYGNGDQINRSEYSGALDIVAHEHTHGVTECTSNLLYDNEPGALNEAFSDILGSSAEFFAAEPDTSNCRKATGQVVCADWWIGEDIDLTSDAVPGFRNMADPEEDGLPDHYDEYVVTTEDNGGVHINSSIPSHAYYLLVNGGMNTSCAQPASHSAAHCGDPADTQDNDLTVTGIGMADAEPIAFLGYTSLQSDASFCDARLAEEAAAEALFGSASQQLTSTRDSWIAVGVTDMACGIVADTDGDGIADSGDNCPSTANPDQTDFDADGAGDVCDDDIDGDEVPNASDDEADGDGFPNATETGCGSDPFHSARVPERVDGPFTGVDDDGNDGADEPLPPGAEAFDCDGDGYIGSAENDIFSGATAGDQDACGTDAWPSDIVAVDTSENRLTLQDVTSFIFPSPGKLNSSPGDVNFDARWDLQPGPGAGEYWIALSDVTSLLFGPAANPPMLDGARAFNGPECPWP